MVTSRLPLYSESERLGYSAWYATRNGGYIVSIYLHEEMVFQTTTSWYPSVDLLAEAAVVSHSKGQLTWKAPKPPVVSLTELMEGES